MVKKKLPSLVEILVELARIRLACGVDSPLPKSKHLFFPDFVKISDLTPGQISEARKYIDTKLKDYGYKIEAVLSKTSRGRNWRDSSYDSIESYSLSLFEKKK